LLLLKFSTPKRFLFSHLLNFLVEMAPDRDRRSTWGSRVMSLGRVSLLLELLLGALLVRCGVMGRVKSFDGVRARFESAFEGSTLLREPSTATLILLVQMKTIKQERLMGNKLTHAQRWLSVAVKRVDVSQHSQTLAEHLRCTTTCYQHVRLNRFVSHVLMVIVKWSWSPKRSAKVSSVSLLWRVYLII